ncbi:hypothetical protein H6P81_006805 [Aristolochia fimbriata]|uniref:Uncharacterized protein n=1 Tax=Aristolochia fimbriata TaxID=158543 RepID=A0AAV7F234_ARIFI|nr:hypothetical protein H6P81_006805 [Aristolochia fimbriata]
MSHNRCRTGGRTTEVAPELAQQKSHQSSHNESHTRGRAAEVAPEFAQQKSHQRSCNRGRAVLEIEKKSNRIRNPSRNKVAQSARAGRRMTDIAGAGEEHREQYYKERWNRTGRRKLSHDEVTPSSKPESVAIDAASESPEKCGNKVVPEPESVAIDTAPESLEKYVSKVAPEPERRHNRFSSRITRGIRHNRRRK